MFENKNAKIIYTRVNPNFTIIYKSGFLGGVHYTDMLTFLQYNANLNDLENHITGRIAYISQMAIRPVPDK